MKEQERASTLFTAFSIYTLITYVWTMLEFGTKGDIVAPLTLSAIYITMLTLYVGDKEVKRLRMKYKSRFRPGEYFAYLWGITFVIVSVYVLLWGRTKGFTIPNDLATNAGVVLLFYFMTDVLKARHQRKSSVLESLKERVAKRSYSLQRSIDQRISKPRRRAHRTSKRR